jgi:hypothetical protein
MKEAWGSIAEAVNFNGPGGSALRAAATIEVSIHPAILSCPRGSAPAVENSPAPCPYWRPGAGAASGGWTLGTQDGEEKANEVATANGVAGGWLGGGEWCNGERGGGGGRGHSVH